MFRWKAPAPAWIAVALLGLLSAVGCSSSGNQKNEAAGEKAGQPQGASANYSVRVLVIDAKEAPVEDAKVTASLGGEAKKTSGGWQIEVPGSSLPASGAVFVYATVDNPPQKGETEIRLDADHNPTATVRVTPVKQK